MTKDELRRIALECGFSAGRIGTSTEKIYKTYNGEWVNVTEDLCRFAEKIAAAERETCAHVCEGRFGFVGEVLAERIRARGTT